MQSKSSGLSVSFHWNPVRSPPSKKFPRSRCKHASCLHSYCVYIVGGKDGNVALKDIWRVNIGTLHWEQLNYRGDKLPYLEGHTIVSHRRLLLLFGGGFGDDVDDSALWIINPDLQHIRRHWNETGIPHPCNRRYHSAIVYNSTLYIYGGYVDLKGSSPDLWAYHIDDEEWEQVIPRQKAEFTAGPRHGHSAVLYGRDMWVFGGSSDLHPKSDLWKYNFHSQTWSRYKLRFGPPARTGHSACVVKDCMIVFGGENESGLLTNDIWIFSFCSFRWSHMQLSGVSPSPRLWQTLIPVTAACCKGDNSVRTSSMPYLQKKGTASKLQRPKSSPAYSSSRNRVRPESVNQNNSRPGTLDVKNSYTSGNTNNNENFPILLKTPPNPKEEKSPLLDKRSVSNSSVLSTGSQKGVDNPGYERSVSAETISESKECDSKFRKSLSKLDEITNCDTEHLLEKDMPRQRIYLRKGEKSNSPEQILPGQVFHMKPQKYTVSQTFIPLEEMNYKKAKNSPEYVVEDLETDDNWFCKDFTPLVPKDAHRYLNALRDENLPKTEVEMKAIKPKRRVMKRLLSSDDKSRSTSDLFETSMTSGCLNEIKKCSSLVTVETCKIQTLRCWDETENEKSKNGENTLHDFNNENTYQSQNKTNCVPETRTNISRNSKNKATENVEIITPYILLFGGKEIKGSNINIEPISAWKCDVLLRHSDISHGEYQKSSLVI